jgi:hypothetical protein
MYTYNDICDKTIKPGSLMRNQKRIFTKPHSPIYIATSLPVKRGCLWAPNLHRKRSWIISWRLIYYLKMLEMQFSATDILQKKEIRCFPFPIIKCINRTLEVHKTPKRQRLYTLQNCNADCVTCLTVEHQSYTLWHWHSDCVMCLTVEHQSYTLWHWHSDCVTCLTVEHRSYTL